MGLSTILTILLLALRLFSLPASAAPAAAGGYWMGSIARQGSPPFGTAGYKIFRNVQDYGAKGDGVTDDTVAINNAITDGSRCGQGCDSSTTTPAIVYFPAGTYVVSKPIVQLYFTQLVGDALAPPTLKASAGFQGMAVIDADPYADGGVNWYTNQNNFYRQIRNFVIDLTAMPASAGAGIHWQVAQATSLQNLVFNMVKGGDNNKQLGIFMDNGSGGFMTDLTFNGGNYGAFFGNQQFTTRNMTFNDCNTAIFMNWNWAWTLQGLTINNCKVGIDMSNGGKTGQTVGSVLVVDTVMRGVTTGILTAYQASGPAVSNGTLILDNVDLSGATDGVVIADTKQAIVKGGQKVASYAQGRTPASAAAGSAAVAGGASVAGVNAVQAVQSAIAKPTSLMAGGNVFTRSRPQYENLPASSFVSVKSAGAKGDGKTDDTAAIQAVLNSAADGSKVVFFDHGAYLVTNTIKVPKDVKITGEIWPMIMAGGSSAFSDIANPKPVFQVGQPGDVGSAELSELVFQTAGPQPGAVLVEWNVAQASQGSAGMWDVHARVGGSAGTQLQLAQCAKNPNNTHAAVPACYGAALMLHVTSRASIYLENNWFWVADHDLEPAAKSQQIDVYSGRGVLIESAQGPVWAFGTASEHSALYNYQIANASAVYMSLIQTETPYYQGNPDAASSPFKPIAALSDPDFSQSCKGSTNSACARAWGLRVLGSSDVFVYGAGLYSFFDNYLQTCLATESCQQNMVSIENSKVHLVGLTTKASTNMLTVNGQSVALDKDYRSVFGATLALFQSS